MFLSNALIGLREGLEAGIIVMIMTAFLASRGRQREIRLIWFGVGVAIAASAAAWAVFAITQASLDDRGKLIFEAAASGLAVLFITSMIFWMRHSAQEEKQEIEGKVSRAMGVGPAAVFTVAFAAVFREGLEAAVFVLVLSKGGSAAQSVSGLLAGVVVAVVLSWMLHLGVVRINMARFLTITGLLLAFIAAGVLTVMVEASQELNLLPGANSIAFDATAILPPDSWHGHFVHGLLGISGHPTVLAVAVWVAYLAIVLSIFLRFSLRVPRERRERLAASDA